jgi:extracellular elastinolytic metalloproteinase
MRRSAVLIAILVVSGIALAVSPPARGPLPDLDVRMPAPATDRDALVLRRPGVAQEAAAELWRLALPGLVLRWDPRSGGPKWMAGPDGASLTAPVAEAPEAVARGFVVRHAALFGLTATDAAALEPISVVPAPDGGAHVHFRQQVGGIDVFDSHALINVRGDGSVGSLSSSLYAGARVLGAPTIDATTAVSIAVLDAYPGIVFTGEVAEEPGERPDARTVFDDEGFGAAPTARLVLFPDATSTRLAWEVRASEPTRFTDYQTLIDAADGSILLRRNLTRYATARVLTSQVPVPLTEEFAPENWEAMAIPDSASPTAESPAGWIEGDGSVLRGNNAVTHVGYVRNPPLSDPAGDYDLPYNTTRSATVNAWWVANEYHDYLRPLGFDEVHGNFQQDNFGLGGVGGDPMDMVVIGLGGRNGAFYGHGGGDGEMPSISFLWGDCELCGDHDGYPETGGDRHSGFGGDVVVHEYGHGVSIRLTGGPSTNCQIGLQAFSMGEGWSDYFAETFYDDPNLGKYFVGRRGFLRTALNDLDYDDLCDIGTSCGNHDNGMIWQAAVWDLRTAFIALDPVNGLEDVDRLVLESLATSACFPSYVTARDAILDADQTLFGGAHRGVIWNVFARRGLGQGAFSMGPDDASPTASFTVPITFQCLPPASPGSLLATPDGDNAIRLDYTATGASAVEIRRDDLGNPFDPTHTIAYTTDGSTFTDESVQGGRSYRYEVVPLGSAGPPCAGGASPTADATATGTCAGFPVFDPEPTVTDGPSCSVAVSWQAAQPLCAGQPVIYNVYRAPVTGFEPSERTLIGRTTGTSFSDTPPDDGRTFYYLVLAQHGTAADPPDHRDRGSSQVLRWAPGLPATSRATQQFWDFEAGPQGWTTDNSADPSGGWVLVAPSPTSYGGGLLAPDEAAGGAGMAWVTGDAGGPSKVHEFDTDGEAQLISPVFDGTAGATLLSFDYWSHDGAEFFQGDVGLRLAVDNGSETVVARVVSGMTVQAFPTAGRRSWQRAAVDLSTLIQPTSTMQVRFVPYAVTSIAEFGVDNVRIESGQACARSALSIRSVTVDDTSPGGGNGNGVLDPGETAILTVELANDGPVTAFAPEVRLAALSEVVRVHDAEVVFPDIAPGTTASAAGFSLTLSADVACEDTAVLDFEIVDAAGTRAVESLDAEFGFTTTEIVFEDDFETDKGWLLRNDPGPGAGQWQRGDPVGTLDGGVPANPEDDSPGDAGTFCYVTENGTVGGGADDNDVDAVSVELFSPKLDLRPYKRARMKSDVWFYNDSDGADFFEDLSQLLFLVDDGEFAVGMQGTLEVVALSTAGWESFEVPVNAPMVDQMRLGISVRDQGPLDGPGYTDSTVEAGIDNVRVEGDAVTCDPTGVVNPPNGIGDTLRVDRTVDEAVRSWTAPPADASHDGAAYYRVFVSSAADSGFSEEATTVTTSAGRALSGTSPAEFYLVSVVNGAGDSGDAPAP